MFFYRLTTSTDHVFEPHKLLAVSEKRKNTLVSEILGMNIFHKSLTVYQIGSLVLLKFSQNFEKTCSVLKSLFCNQTKLPLEQVKIGLIA